MTDVRLVGFEELSATTLRDRLLARRPEFWSGSALGDAAVIGLHDPLFFHQLGGFGALALSADGEDAGYLLGVVSADRLAVVHAVAVHPSWRRHGIAARLVGRFAEHGLRRSTMQSVAAAAGVAKATLYNHFRTKDDVATALLGLEIDRLTALAAGLPLEQALAALSDELGAHPVLRRMAETEPEALVRLLAVDADRWADLTGRLAASLRVDADAAEIAARWLLGVVLQPGRSTARHRHAARLAELLTATGAAASA